MIVPTFSLKTIGTNDLEKIVAHVKHWSLLGKVAITDVDADDLDSLSTVIKQVGGLVDLQIKLTSFDEQAAIGVLNDGATSVICGPEKLPELETLPPDRCVHLLVDDNSDQAIAANHLVLLTQPTAAKIAELEMARIDCYVSTEQLDQQPDLITDFLQSVLVSDRPDGLWPTVIVDPLGAALGLAYSNRESLQHAIENRCGTYWSRSRDGLWIKGETSGAIQKLLAIRFDCDRDCLRFTVTQDPPGFCHLQTHTCFGPQRTITSVIDRLASRIAETDEKSFTRKLANDPKMLEAKLLEEAQELADASQTDDKNEIAWEAADVLYFSLIALLKNGVGLDQVYHELCRRMSRVVRRPNKLEPSEKEQS